MTAMINPWDGFSISDGIGVHPDDLPFVLAHNRVTQDPDLQIQLAAWPQPWAGNILGASILVLSANPGWSAGDPEADRRLAPLLEANLSGNWSLFWLDDAARNTPGEQWVRTRLLKDVLDTVPEQVSAAAVCLVEFHPYHSAKWASFAVTLSTQKYTFELVRRRVQAGATVVITRAAKEWLVAVPELLEYPAVYRTNSTQNPRLSERNLGTRGWDELTGRLHAIHRIWFDD
jgi:hypothetical protein